MFVVKKTENDKYILKDFVDDHNHPLESSQTSHFLRSHRHIEPSQAGLIRNMSASGIKTSNIFSYLSSEAGGAENLNFIQSDCYNFVSKTRTEFLCRGDAQCLLEYLTKKLEVNRSFFYKLRVDEDNRICSCFFSDPKSRCDYANFGDVVCFDTTYKTNNYNMICAPFVGVNHHAQTVIFGCALLDCETTESFVWLFQTFLNAMGGKQPQTIFTDQAAAIANAIQHVFPNTHHRLCLWHIYQNAANLSGVFSQFQSFSKDMKNCIYEPETVEEFEECWNSLLGKYELHQNAWLENLYGLKDKWTQVYARCHFCAGMTTTQRSESINNFLKHFFAGNLILREFVAQFDKALADRRMKERQSDTRTRQTRPILMTAWAVESEASIKYTRKIFQLFQDELKKSFTLKCKVDNDDGTTRSYSVRDMGRQSSRVRTVTCMIIDTFLVTCSCRKFEFHGILCAHILKFLLDELEVSSLPSQYYLPRWCADAASRLVYDGNGELINSDLDPLASRRYSELMSFAQTVAAKGAITDEKSAIAKSELVNVIAKLDSIQITDE